MSPQISDGELFNLRWELENLREVVKCQGDKLLDAEEALDHITSFSCWCDRLAKGQECPACIAGKVFERWENASP